MTTKRPRLGRLVGSATVFLLWWLATAFVVLNLWIVSNFGQLELDQFIYHIVNIDEVIKPMSPVFVALSFVALFGIPTAAALTAVHFLARKRGPKKPEVPYRFVEQAGRRRLIAGVEVALVSVLVPSLVLGVATPSLANNIGVFSFVENSKPSSFIEAFYRFPEALAAPEKPTNLVMIYVESLENTYREEELWGENLLDSLDEATAEWATFPQFTEVRGTGWTIAGIVASQCGVLLKEENSFDIAQQLGLKSINRIGERVDEFMPGITCLGDVLDDAGYKNVFMGGADPDFAGKGKFLKEHGYDRVLGQPFWEMTGETEFTKWGLHDDDLLRHAKEQLVDLQESGEPFNLTVLTVDTHRPEGHLSPTCQRKGAEDLPGIVACTSDMLADFVYFMEERGYLENTAVVITGDHLTMPNVVQETIDLEPNRTIYNRFYAPQGMEPNREELIHFSIFPTVLDMLGFSYPGDGLALGLSGVKPLENDAFTIYDVRDLDDKLRRPSELYEVFWGVDNPGSSSQG